MFSRFWRLAVLALAIAPVAASGDQTAEVVLATPGTGDGAIERFTMRFSADMVPLGDPRAKAPIKVECPVGGAGRWIDPKTFVWDFAKALPGGVTCQFVLKDYLKTLAGSAIGGTRRFTVDTGGPSVRAVLPRQYGGDIEEDQVFLVATNVRPDLRSVATHGYCAVDGLGEKIALDILPQKTVSDILTGLGEESYDVSDFLGEAGVPIALSADPASLSTITAVKCRRPLPPGRDVALVWSKDIAGGGRLAGRDQRFDFSVRRSFEARFECGRINPQAGCNPVQRAWVRFTAPIPVATAQAIRLDISDGRSLKPKVDNDGDAMVSQVSFEAPLPASVTAKVILPAGVKDESGRKLSNAERFPLDVRIDESPPLVKFAADFGILEAGEGGVLPVTVRNVEPELQGKNIGISGESLRVAGSDGDVAKWLREIARVNRNDIRTEKRGKDEITVNYTGTEALISNRQGTSAMKLDLPGKGKDFEVVGIPLAKPGFYVVELASPRLGQALLGRNVPRYVTAGALVTNMSVHFKWGRAASLAWVTALDTGQPVAGAEVRVTDSCSGLLLAQGISDKAGRLLVKGGLPDPETYGDCEGDQHPHPLMISARAGEDFSFTLTDWGNGIRPYDFDLPYGWSESADLLHTIFDRTLMRAGETVHMKHIQRKPVAEGFAYGAGLTGTLRLSHRGSGTEFELPLTIGPDGIGETSWTAPKGAPQGDYDLSIAHGDQVIYTGQSIKVEEFRLPTMRATIAGPGEALIRPANVPVELFVGYLSGGGAANLPVRIRTAFSRGSSLPRGWEGWSFGGRSVAEGTVPLNGDGEEIEQALPPAQTLPVALGPQGTGKALIDVPTAVGEITDMTVEMDYADANGEILTASRQIQLFPSAVRLGIKTDGWMMRADDLRLKFVALDTGGRLLKGQRISVALYSREILTARRRLIGGFYAYDNQARTTKLAASCAAVTDRSGQASCAIDPAISGELWAVATTTDANGNVARAVTSVWLAGADEWWFGGDNGDRMDVIPERTDYKAGETAKFQVRMPFREATALVTVEREGVLSSFVTKLSGKDPVISVKMPGSYAPDVFVSVMAVRGRVNGFKLWLADTAKKWNIPYLSKDGQNPTALVDLAKPSFRLGMAKVKVGWESHRLGVKVTADKAKYAVRETANVDVEVKRPGGKSASTAEIAFVAVDEALLQLQPNESWKLIDAMMGERVLSVLTATAQTQVVGKRHYGKKAVEIGGGGGDLSALNREDFRPVLLWKGRVKLDGKGRAKVQVPMSDSLSAFRLVAIATDGPGLFGTGETSVRTVQDLAVYSGLPPLVRSGDQYGASFTLRNGTAKPMTVTATAAIDPAVAVGAPLTVTIPANGAVPVTWNLTAPEGVDTLNWTVVAKAGKATDRITVSQDVIPAIPIETWASAVLQVGPNAQVPIAAPQGALPGLGSVDVRLSDTLAPPMAAVRDYMARYPYNCFEQQFSRAIVLGDMAAWSRLSEDMPAYLDPEGLLRYFPVERMGGSEALTAYVLSLSAEAGWTIPAGSKDRMIKALMAVIDGRLRRETAWSGDARLQRIAALAALARNGVAQPAMLGAIGMAPQDMPSGTLADWLVIIDKTKGLTNQAQLRKAAEAVLRQRIVYEGSRFDLTDAKNAPWWMMSSGDEMALKVLMATLGKPGWQDDTPRLMIGAALRQQRGHWDTTPANAWGAIAVMRFAQLYPAQAIAGTTTLTLGAQTLTRSWPQTADAAPLSFALPIPPAPLMLRQSGGVGPWAMVSVRAAVPLLQPLFAGYKMAKSLAFIQQQVPGRTTRGDVLKVTITVDATADRNWVVINDPVVPGGTIVSALGGQSALLAAAGEAGNEGVQPSYIERGKDAWRAYFEWVPRGRFTVSYAVRLNGTGRFSLPPTRVEAMYSPDIRAQWPNAPVAVEMQ